LRGYICEGHSFTIEWFIDIEAEKLLRSLSVTDTVIIVARKEPTMRVRDWQDILEDVTESKADPDDWRAIVGNRASGPGEDLYLGNPGVGLFQVKTYAKNPFQVKGVGARIDRGFDEDVGQFFPDEDGTGRFAVQEAPEDEDTAKQRAKRVEEVIEAHADAPTEPGHLFDDVMDALESPAFGPIDGDHRERPEDVDELTATFEDAEEALEAEFEDLIQDDEIDRGFQ